MQVGLIYILPMLNNRSMKLLTIYIALCIPLCNISQHKPGKQHAISRQRNLERLCTGQGRAGLRRKRSDPINQPINQPTNMSQKIPGRMRIETGITNQVHTRDLTHSINTTTAKRTKNNPLIPDVPFHPGPVYRPHQNQSDMTCQINRVHKVHLA